MTESTHTQIVVEFLKKCGIPCSQITDIDGLQIPRAILISTETYDKVKDQIPLLKTLFSSSYLTSLQSSAEDTQKWPLLNLVRQILKSCNRRLVPKRLCDGYTKDGKKKYRRVFLIEALKDIESVEDK